MGVERQPIFSRLEATKQTYIFESPPTSEKELFLRIIASADKLEKRSAANDIADYLRIRKVNYSWEFIQRPEPNLPILVAPNHYYRSFFERRGPSTTGESFLTTAVVTSALQNLTDRETRWVIKRLPDKVFGISRLDRKAQNAMAFCYDYIPAVNLKVFKMSSNTLQEGVNLGFYPEQNPPFSPKNLLNPTASFQLRPYHPAFRLLLKELQRKRVEYQILPVSVYTENDRFMVKFSQPIRPDKSDDVSEIAGLTMRLIAEGLPKKFRGDYA